MLQVKSRSLSPYGLLAYPTTKSRDHETCSSAGFLSHTKGPQMMGLGINLDTRHATVRNPTLKHFTSTRATRKQLDGLQGAAGHGQTPFQPVSSRVTASNILL